MGFLSLFVHVGPTLCTNKLGQKFTKKHSKVLKYHKQQEWKTSSKAAE